jgi:hypothetical protein
MGGTLGQVRVGLSCPWARVWVTFTHLQLNRRLREREECSIWNSILSHIFSESKLSLTLACLNFPMRDKILKKSEVAAEGLFSSSESALSWQGAAEPNYKGKLSLLLLCQSSFRHKVTPFVWIIVPYGDHGCSWSQSDVCLQRSVALLPHDLGPKGFYPGRDKYGLEGVT